MIVAVDTGGTKTLIALLNKQGKLEHSAKFPTPGDQAEYVAFLREILQENYSSMPIEAISVALPGIVKNGVALWCNNLGWKNFHAARELAGILGETPVFIENDANLAGLAEARSLEPIPTSVLYVTISTGIGTGIITNGQIDPGLRYSEGGRLLLEYDGAIREWEDFASGRAIRATYDARASEITSKRSWHQIADRVSRGFLVMIPLIQPDVVIIGGGVGTHFSHFASQLEALLKERLPAHIPCPTFLQALHPEEAVIFGGYYHALEQLPRR